MSEDEAYGLWPLVILNSFVFIIFAFSFAKPQSKFPVLVFMYARLAASEEREMRATFGQRCDAYAATTPAFVPRLFGPTIQIHT